MKDKRREVNNTMKLNKKGFTLVEVLAVIIILSVLMAIMIPTVNHIINKNDNDSYEKLKEGIVNATKVYISDNRYNITLSGPCENDDTELSIQQIGEALIDENGIRIKALIDKKYLKTKKGEIINPETKKTLIKEESYIKVKYSCKTREYVYDLKDESLKWNEAE